jgi:hypothetical protein
MYHVMNRGDQREDIFRDDQDRQKFLSPLGEACAKTEWQAGKEIERLGWEEDPLRAHRKGHLWKVKLARRLRQETTLSLQGIAARLEMGTWTYVSNLLNEPQKNQPQAQELLPLCQS